MTWQEFWNSVVSYFSDNWRNFVWFGIVLAAGLILVPLFLMLVKKIMRHNRVDEIAIRFVAAVLRFCLFLILILILLAIIGIPLNGLVTAISACILAIGMALKEFLSNIAAGIVLVASKNFKKGDFIQVLSSGGSITAEGNIIDINFLFTTIKTFQNVQVTFPNNTITNSAVNNLSAYPIRRVDIIIPVAYESDTTLVRKTLVNVMLSCGMVYEDPAPLCRLKTLDNSSINFFLTCYCDTEDYWDVFYYIMDRGFDALKAAGITIPFPQVTISQHSGAPMPVAYDGLPERVEKTRKKRYVKKSVDELEDAGFSGMGEMFRQGWMSPEELEKRERRLEKKADQKAKSDKKKKKGEDHPA